MILIGEKIKVARIERNLTQGQLAKLIGEKSATVINNWEKSVARPAVEKIPKICEALHITPNDLFEMDGEHPSLAEMTMIRKYRTLDSFGQTAIDSLLNIEYSRTLSMRSQKTKTRMLKLDYYNIPASAGTGNFLNTETPEEIFVRETSEAEKADFVISIRGDSMEPTYHDGDKVFVAKRDTVEEGEIGIFVINGEAYIKELGNKCLISHNKAYRPIPLNPIDSVYCCGKVLGAVEE